MQIPPVRFALAASAVAAFLLCAAVSSAQFPGVQRDGGSGRGLGIGSYDTKTVTHERVLSGTVHDKNGAVLKGAIVYLKNDSTSAVKSVTVDDNGKFRFPQLSRSVDYQLWAGYKDKKTEPKTISQFDTRDELSRDLKIE